MSDTKAPEGGWQYTARVRSKATAKTTDITKSLAVMYDLVTSSMDWGSGFWSTEDMQHVVQVGVLCGFDVPTCEDTYSEYAGEYPSEELAYARCQLLAAHSEDHQGDGIGRGDPPVPIGLVRWNKDGERVMVAAGSGGEEGDMAETVEADPCVVERPGMKPYRARKAPTAQHWDDDESDGRCGVMVLRTHDIELATRMARDCFRYVDEELPDPFPVPVTQWLRLVPWGGDSGSWIHAAPGERGAVPCVTFEVHQ